MASTAHPNSRRRFLRMLAASPLLPFVGLSPTILKAFQQEQNPAGSLLLHDLDPDGTAPAVLKAELDYLDHLTSAKDALTVFDLEYVARKKLHAGHLAYTAGTEDATQLRANREGFNRYGMRARRLVDTRNIDMSVNLFGVKWNTPLLLCPVGYQGAFNPDGEFASARAAKAKGHLQALSTATSKSIEDVTAARGAPVWTQAPVNNDWSRTRGALKRAEAAGCPVIFLTVDTAGGDKREILARVRRQNATFCSTCHTLYENEGLSQQALSGPGFRNAAAKNPWPQTPPVGPPEMEQGPRTWDYVKKLKDATTMKVLVKGIVTREDAELAMEHGADGVWVSNHGGHGENSGRGAIECLPEVVEGVRGRGPVIVDGGFRRGGDLFKALALGASAIGVGRPYIWGLASFGQDGVEAALDILDSELRMVMAQMGAPTVSRITKDFVVEHR